MENEIQTKFEKEIEKASVEGWVFLISDYESIWTTTTTRIYNKKLRRKQAATITTTTTSRFAELTVTQHIKKN